MIEFKDHYNNMCGLIDEMIKDYAYGRVNTEDRRRQAKNLATKLVLNYAKTNNIDFFLYKDFKIKCDEENNNCFVLENRLFCLELLIDKTKYNI